MNMPVPVLKSGSAFSPVPAIVDENKCIGCGICTTKCEFEAIHLERDLPGASVMRKSEDKLKYILPYGAKQAIKIKFKKK